MIQASTLRHLARIRSVVRPTGLLWRILRLSTFLAFRSLRLHPRSVIVVVGASTLLQPSMQHRPTNLAVVAVIWATRSATRCMMMAAALTAKLAIAHLSFLSSPLIAYRGTAHWSENASHRGDLGG